MSGYDLPKGYAAIVSSLGLPTMSDVLLSSINQIAKVDELFGFCIGTKATHPQIAVTTGWDGQAPLRARIYRERFYRSDPLRQLLQAHLPAEEVLVTTVAPGQIDDRDYRRVCYQEPNFAEKACFACLSSRGWTVLSLFRRKPSGSFASSDLSRLRAMSSLLLPLIDKQCELISPPSEESTERGVARIEHRLTIRHPELTRRELAVCARTALGMSAYGIALDLDVKKTSVLTYRRRAYQRLNISTGYELMKLLL